MKNLFFSLSALSTLIFGNILSMENNVTLTRDTNEKAPSALLAIYDDIWTDLTEEELSDITSNFTKKQINKKIEPLIRGGKLDILKHFWEMSSKNKIKIHIIFAETNKQLTLSPLEYAFMRGDIAIIDYLLSAGASFANGELEKDNPNLFSVAAVNGLLHVIDYLYNKKIIDPQLIDKASEKEPTPLQAACRLGHRQIIEYLLKKGANLFSEHRQSQ